jgi:DNA-binding NarL/FixJ family response regulator
MSQTKWPQHNPRRAVALLDSQQRHLLTLLGRGWSLLEAASRVKVSPRTAHRRLARARSTLGVATNAEAILLVLGHSDSSERSAALSARERQVMGLVANGLTSGAIATRLALANSTVDSLIKSAMEKLDARTRAQAAVLARADALNVAHIEDEPGRQQT